MSMIQNIPMGYRLYIQLDQLPKSLNKKLRSHRFKNHSENKSWDNLICNQFLNWDTGAKLPKTPLKRAKISILRHAHRTLDYDGLVGSMKPVVDALVSAGVLSDDSWNVLGKWDVDQRFRAKKEGQLLEIIVQEMPLTSEFDPKA